MAEKRNLGKAMMPRIKAGRFSIKLPPEPRFDPETHSYSDDLGELPSVTRILASAGMKHESYGFAWADTAAQLRGIRVHTACHLDDEGDLDESTVRDSERGYLEAWRSAKALYKWRTIRSELPIMHPALRYAGCLDKLGIICCQNSAACLAIADLKTGSAPWWTRYQLTGYLLCFEKPLRFVRVCFELHEDGTHKIVGPWGLKTWEADKNVWFAALTIHTASKENK